MAIITRIRFFARALLGSIGIALNHFLFSHGLRIQDANSVSLIFFRRIRFIVLVHRIDRNENHRLFEIDIDILSLLHHDIDFSDGFVTSLVTINTLNGIHTLRQALEVQSILLDAVLFVTVNSNAPVDVNKVCKDHIAFSRSENLDNRSKLVEHHEHGLISRVAINVRVGVRDEVASVAFFVGNNLTLFVYDVGNSSLVTIFTLSIVGHRKGADASLQVNFVLVLGIALARGALRSFSHQVTFGIPVKDLARFSISLVGNRNLLALDIDNGRDFNDFGHRLLAIFVKDCRLDDFALFVHKVRDGNGIAIHDLVVRNLGLIANRLFIDFRLRILFERNFGLRYINHVLDSLIRYGNRIQDDDNTERGILARNRICHRDLNFLSLVVHVEGRVLLINGFDNCIDVFCNDLRLRSIDIDNRSGSTVANFNRIGTSDILVRSLIRLDNVLATFLQRIKAGHGLAILLPFNSNDILVRINRLVLRLDVNGVTSFNTSNLDFGLFNNIADLDTNFSSIREFAIRHIDLDYIGLFLFVIKFTLQDDIAIRLDFELFVFFDRIELQIAELLVLDIRIGSFDRPLLGTWLGIFREREFLRFDHRRFIQVVHIDNDIAIKFKAIGILDSHRDGKLLHGFVIDIGAFTNSDFTIRLNNHVRIFLREREEQIAFAIRVRSFDNANEHIRFGVFIDTELLARDFRNFRHILKSNLNGRCRRELRIRRLDILIRQSDFQFECVVLFAFVVEIALSLDLTIFGNIEEIRVATNCAKLVLSKGLGSIDIIRIEATDNIVLTLIFVERECSIARDNRHFVHVNEIDCLGHISGQLIGIHHIHIDRMSMSKRFVIQAFNILYNKAKFVLGSVLLDFSIKQTVRIRVTIIRHIRNERCYLTFVFILDFVASDFRFLKRFFICIFLNVIAILAIVNNFRTIRIVNNIDGYKRSSREVLKVRSANLCTISLTIICSLSQDLILLFRFIVQRLGSQVDIAFFINIKDGCVTRTF